MILSAARARKSPTPNPTQRMSVVLLIAVICSASTFKSGSAIVIITPIIKAIKASATSDIYVDYPIIITDTETTKFNIITEKNEKQFLKLDKDN